MDLLKLFDPNGTFERTTIKPKKEYAIPIQDHSTRVREPWRANPESGTEYAKKYVEEEDAKALQSVKMNFPPSGGAIDEVSLGTLQTVTDVDNSELTKVYNNYDFEYRPKKDLVIFKNKQEIIATVQTHSVTVIEGVTGCGKSTQVPQFILDSCKEQRKHCNIIVTQPRRIAAVSIANRVCTERGWQLGSIVGVQVGMYRNISQDTRLTYCTTGVLLRKLIRAKNMLEYTHIVLDEVHERDQEMDFLLLVIKKLLRSNSRQVKVVLMSATFNVTKFSKYFSTPTESGLIPAPVISVEKKRNYKVLTYYLDQLDGLGVLPEIDPAEPRVTPKMMERCMNLISIFDEIDKNSECDDEDLIESGGEKPYHAVLVFLPGIWEIEELHGLMVQADHKSNNWDIVILHSCITSEEQKKVFVQPAKGKRRIILATNLAESSITIHDVRYVIDFCLTKQLVTDPMTNFQCLELTWASKSNCEQRAGRAGRVMDGRVYRLIPKELYMNLKNESDPEILRAPLESLVLQTKILDMGEPKALLALAIDPPDVSNLERTILLLKEAGGLVNKPNASNRFDGIITSLGRIMAALPIDIHLSKLIALGHVFNVLRATIIMAAAMATKCMFNNPFNKRMEAYEAKIHWAEGSSSDCIAMFNAYSVWNREITYGRLKKKSANEINWAKRHFIQIKVLHEVDYLVQELTLRLERLGIKETSGPNKPEINEIERSTIFKIVIAGAFYPNYFFKNNTLMTAGDNTGGAKALAGLDPTRSVFMTGWKIELPGRLYAKRIQEKFKSITPLYQQIVVEFDGSSRVYIMFPDGKFYENQKKQSGIPGKVSLLVYKALKMRKLQPEMFVEVMDVKSSIRIAEQNHISKTTATAFYTEENLESLRQKLPTTVPHLPPIDVTEIPIQLVNYSNPKKFWVHIADSKTAEKLALINNFLNDPKNISLQPLTEAPKIGSLVATRGRQNRMKRAVIESYTKVKDEDVAQVCFIDFGYRGPARVTDMRTITETHKIFRLPALALECSLAHIGPSIIKDPNGFWTESASKEFLNFMNQPNVTGKIYSITDSVVSLEVLLNSSKNETISLNDKLVEEELAEKVEESYLSKYNHNLRSIAKTRTLKELAHREYLEYLQYDRNFLIQTYPTPPPITECGLNVILKGPSSPLEVTFSSLAARSACKKVNIESQSVNSIVLNMDPEDAHGGLLVSTVVSQSPNGNHLTLRNTTLLPNLPGLSSLICLLFAPKIELRRNNSGSHYIGALCGLGYNTKNEAALMEEHDLDIHFDTEITIPDMQIINRMRHYINLGICVKNDEVDDFNTQAVICQSKLIKFFKDWSNIKRKSQRVEKILNSNRWGLYSKDLFWTPKEDVIQDDSIYPLHNALILEEHDEKVEDLKVHLMELRELSISDMRLSENIEVECQLCNEMIYRREDLRVHLFMEEHRNRERACGLRK